MKNDKPVSITATAELERLRPYENAARIYCKKVDMNPDFNVPSPHPTLQGVVVDSPFWVIVAEKMVDLSFMLTSMREAGEAIPPKVEH